MSKSYNQSFILSLTILKTLTIDYQEYDLRNLISSKLPEIVHYICSVKNRIYHAIQSDYKNQYIGDCLKNWEIQNIPSLSKVLQLINHGDLTITEMRGFLKNQTCLNQYINQVQGTFNDDSHFIIHYDECIKKIMTSYNSRNTYDIATNVKENITSHGFSVLAKYCQRLQIYMFLLYFGGKNDLLNRNPELIDQDEKSFSGKEMSRWRVLCNILIIFRITFQVV